MGISRVHLCGEAVADETVPILEGLDRDPMRVSQAAAVEILFAFAPDAPATGVTLKLQVTKNAGTDEEVIYHIVLNSGNAIPGSPATTEDPAEGDGFTCGLTLYPGLDYDFLVDAPGTLIYLQADEVS